MWCVRFFPRQGSDLASQVAGNPYLDRVGRQVLRGTLRMRNRSTTSHTEGTHPTHTHNRHNAFQQRTHKTQLTAQHAPHTASRTPTSKIQHTHSTHIRSCISLSVSVPLLVRGKGPRKQSGMTGTHWKQGCGGEGMGCPKLRPWHSRVSQKISQIVVSS